MKTYEYDFSIGEGYSRLRDNPGGWTDGVYVTQYGFVDVYAQGDDRFSNFTRLEIIKDGRVYVRQFKNKRYTKRGIATKAKEFARDLFK